MEWIRIKVFWSFEQPKYPKPPKYPNNYHRHHHSHFLPFCEIDSERKRERTKLDRREIEGGSRARKW
ncbi:hypothetical protein Sjap_000575 [Stephania japonica]|uniref:Uncharacterized protein n=1 Tax=Stephania japonica TaxID=461633 RepID=A0AAP0KJB2_9MAGN